MAFRKKWFSSEIVSTDGYFVRPYSPGAILYGDGLNKVYVGAEAPASGSNWMLYPEDMRVGSRWGKKLQDEERRSLITDRIAEVFGFLGWEITIP